MEEGTDSAAHIFCIVSRYALLPTLATNLYFHRRRCFFIGIPKPCGIPLCCSNFYIDIGHAGFTGFKTHSLSFCSLLFSTGSLSSVPNGNPLQIHLSNSNGRCKNDKGVVKISIT